MGLWDKGSHTCTDIYQMLIYLQVCYFNLSLVLWHSPPKTKESNDSQFGQNLHWILFNKMEGPEGMLKGKLTQINMLFVTFMSQIHQHTPFVTTYFNR